MSLLLRLTLLFFLASCASKQVGISYHEIQGHLKAMTVQCVHQMESSVHGVFKIELGILDSGEVEINELSFNGKGHSIREVEGCMGRQFKKIVVKTPAPRKKLRLHMELKLN